MCRGEKLIMIKAAYIEITNRCNLNCLYCYNASGLSIKTEELSAEIIEDIILAINRQTGLRDFEISGGEPLMHSDWSKVLDVMEKLKDFSFFIVTNGIIRDDRLYNLLETEDRFKVQFSIDGADEWSHSKTRGKNNFIKVLNNLASFKHKNIPVIKMVVSKYNMNQIEEYFKLALEYDSKPAFAFAEKMGLAVDNWNDLYLNEYEKLDVIEQIEKMQNKYNIKTKPPYATYKCPLLDESEAIGVSIKSNGSIQPCQIFYDPQFSLGSVYNLDFNTIKINIDQLRKELINWQKKDFGCEKCINREYCHKGCPAEVFMHFNSFDSADGSCSFRKLQTAKINILSLLKNRK